MSERRFVIIEMYDNVDVVQIGNGQAIFRNRIPCITESVLKRRVEWVIQWLNADSNFAFSKSAWEKVRSVVIDGLEGEGENACPECGKIHPWDEMCPKPSPMPTREAWEAWATEMAIAIHDDGGWTSIYKGFLSMPMVPKE